MILERLSVEGFRHLAAPYEFVPDERLTIISAPNGTGKSTLLDALYYGLLEKHTVTGVVAAERFTSRGRNLVPRIVIDFRVGDSRYRLRKHFLSDRLARLERWELGRFLPLKEAAAADDFVRDLFAADAPSRGALDATKHWGLAHILWSPSGVRYTALPSAAGDQVRSMLSDVAMATLGERAVEERVAVRYQRYFTDSGALARSATSANLPSLEAEIGTAKAAVVEAAAAVQRLDDLRRSHEDSSWEAQRLAAMRADVRNRLEETKALAVSFDELTSQRQIFAAAEERWRAQSSELKRRIDAIAELRVLRAGLDAKRDRLKTEIAALGDRLAVSALQLRTLTRAVDDAAALCGRVQMRATEITAAQTYAAARNDVQLLRERIAFTHADLQAIDDLQKRRSDVFAPTRRELNDIRETDVEHRNLEAKIAASALTLEIAPDGDADIDVRSGDRPGTVAIAAGNVGVVTGAEQIIIVIPGFGRIAASAADSAASMRRKAAPLAARLRAYLERFGATSIFELESRIERATELDSEIAMRQRSLAERLHGDEAAADRQRLVEAHTRIEAIESIHPHWRQHRLDATALRAAFDCDLRKSGDLETEAKLRLRAAQQPHDEIRSQLDTLIEAERELTIALQQQTFRLDDLEDDGRSDAVRDAQLMQLSLEWSAARARVEALDRKLCAFAENPHHARAALEVKERETGQQYEGSHGRAQRDLALLEEYSQRGSYRRLAESEEALAALTERLRIERAEAEAIRVLWDLFGSVRKVRIEAVLAPVETGASRYLARIAGTSLGPIRLRQDLTPLGVGDRPTGELVDIESTLSTGEREQIYMATRFAIADVIAGTRGRQLFVLDDILTATDPGRLRRFVTLLEELSRERLQIIVTTADASRYLGISGAKHIDLRAALAMRDAA